MFSGVKSFHYIREGLFAVNFFYHPQKMIDNQFLDTIKTLSETNGEKKTVKNLPCGTLTETSFSLVSHLRCNDCLHCIIMAPSKLTNKHNYSLRR